MVPQHEDVPLVHRLGRRRCELTASEPTRAHTERVADFERLFADVSAKLFDRLPDETWVYPGHGNDTTLGAERPHLPEWRERGW